MLDVSETKLANLDDVAQLGVTELRVANTPVTDLRPIKSMPKLRTLDITGCKFDSLEPLAGTSLREIKLDFQTSRDTAILIGLPSLRKINGMSVQEFWKNQSADD